VTGIVAVGAGWVTLHRHLPGIAATPGLELVGIVDRDVARGSRAAADHDVPHATSLADPALGSFDAVTIGTAPPSHGTLVRQALELGKHVLVEKPFAMDPAEADALVELSRERGRILAVVHNFQFARSVSAARRHVAAGTFGALRGVVGLQLSNDRRRLPTWYRELPGGLFYDEAPRREAAIVEAVRGRRPGESIPAALHRLQRTECSRLGSPGFATFAKVIEDSPALQAKELEIMARFSRVLAEAIQAELGVDERDARIAAGLLVSVHRQLFRSARQQALAGKHGPGAVRRLRADLDRAYQLLEHGLVILERPAGAASALS